MAGLFTQVHNDTNWPAESRSRLDEMEDETYWSKYEKGENSQEDIVDRLHDDRNGFEQPGRSIPITLVSWVNERKSAGRRIYRL